MPVSPKVLHRLMTSIGGLDVGTSVIQYGETVDEVLDPIRKAIITMFPFQGDTDVGLVSLPLTIGRARYC